MRFVRPLLALVLVTAATPLQAQRGRDPIPKLEAERAANPSNVAALRALGVAYHKAGRFEDARTVLDQARRLDPKDGVSALYAGLSAEALGDLTAARTAYNSYLEVGRTRRVKNQIRARLAALSRAEIVAAAKLAVANEAQLAGTPGSPRTIAVPPLRYDGPDPSLAPLGRGLAELIITDLGRSSELTVVERDRMQAIADEIELGRSDRVDGATAVRAGRLIQAGRLIGGSLQQQGGGQLSMLASVVDVPTGEVGQPAQVTNSLDALFAMQKELVFGIFDLLGVRLTPAERQLVEQRATNNLQAFLAYSRGLLASDDGRFQDAARFFETARSLDPGFGAAAAQQQSAQQAALGAQVSAASIETNLGRTSTEGIQVTSALAGSSRPMDRITNTLTMTLRDVNPSTITQVANESTILTVSSPPPQRDAPSSTGGTDDVTATTGQVVIIIRRP
jgi:tetratricopeptide (TPR) repeat protein